MSKEKLIHVFDYYIDKDIRNTTISSKHCSIVRGLANATDEGIEEIKQWFFEYEKEYAKPKNRIKRLVRKIKRGQSRE